MHDGASCAVCARVDRAPGARENDPIADRAIDRACAAAGVSIASDRRYVDEGFSGSRLDRPAFDALRDAAADGPIDASYIYCPDRLARSYVHQQVVLEELAKRGVRVHFVEHPVSTKMQREPLRLRERATEKRVLFAGLPGHLRQPDAFAKLEVAFGSGDRILVSLRIGRQVVRALKIKMDLLRTGAAESVEARADEVHAHPLDGLDLDGAAAASGQPN